METGSQELPAEGPVVRETLTVALPSQASAVPMAHALCSEGLGRAELVMYS